MKILGGSIITLSLSIIISASVVYGAYYFQKKMLLEYNKANSAFQSISGKYLAVDEEEKLIQSFLPEFVSLYEKGIIGEEQRLNWIEALRSIGTSLNLPALNYQIQSQQEYTPSYPLNLGKYKLYSSLMQLDMQLLHEGDLFRVLEALDKQAKGSYTVSSCMIDPVGNTITDKPDAANISAHCELLWFTIKLASGDPIKV